MMGAGGVLSASALTSCGDGDEGKGSDGKAKVTILTSTITERIEGKAEQKIADDFMAKHPDIEIEFIGKPSGDLNQTVLTMATGDTLPDLFFCSEEFAPKARDLGILVDAKEVAGDLIESLNPMAVEMATEEGMLQFMPWFSIPTALIYREDWLAKVNAVPPETMEEFGPLAGKLTTDGKFGFAMVGTPNASGASRFAPILRCYGGYDIQRDGDEWVNGLREPAAAEAFQLYADLAQRFKALPPGVVNVGYPDAVNLVATEKAGMIVSGPHAYGTVLGANPKLKGKLNAAPLPPGANGKSAAGLGLGGYAVTTAAKNKEAVATYLRFLMSEKNQLAWTEATGRLPLNANALKSVNESRDDLKGFIKAIDGAYKFPTAPFYTDILTHLTTGYQACLLGQADGKQAAEKAAALVDQEIERGK